LVYGGLVYFRSPAVPRRPWTPARRDWSSGVVQAWLPRPEPIASQPGPPQGARAIEDRKRRTVAGTVGTLVRGLGGWCLSRVAIQLVSW